MDFSEEGSPRLNHMTYLYSDITKMEPYDRWYSQRDKSKLLPLQSNHPLCVKHFDQNQLGK